MNNTKGENKKSRKGLFVTMGALMTLVAMTVYKKGKEVFKGACDKCKGVFNKQ